MYLEKINMNLIILLLFNFLALIHAKDYKSDVTTSATPTTTLQRTLVSNEVNSSKDKDVLKKRDTKASDQSSANTLVAKSYDPPPEFYRGPGSTGPLNSGTSSYYNNNNNNFNSNNNYNKLSGGFVSKPIAFPDTNSNSHAPYPDNGGQLAGSYNSWQQLKNKTALFGALLNKTGIQDRISVGHFGNPLHDSRPYSGTHHEYVPSGHHYATSHTGAAAYDTRPYSTPYSTPYAHVDYGHQTGGSSYYGGGGGTTVGEGLPFDVYGMAGGGSGKGQFAGSGGDYSYTYSDMHDSVAHKTFPDLSQKALLAKSFLIPLASAAVLGIAAALVSNPLLLQLGTVSGVAPASFLGKRKKRSVTDTIPTTLEQQLKKKDSRRHPYRGHHRRFVRTS